MVRFLCVWGTRILWVLPFLIIPGIFALFWIDRIPGLPDDLASRGQFGDSFGVLNSLFTGLGFAGLLVTIGLQQRQIRRQSEDFQAQLHDIGVRRYEDNLFRLLALYHDALSSVISTRDGHKATGRDVLSQATEWLLKSIRQEGVNSVPHEIQTRFRAGALTAEDRDVLDFLYYRNFWHLNYGLNRQGRLLDTFKALLRYLEDGAPKGVDRKEYRRIVFSQITHIEISYYFFVALGVHAESELRDLLKRSTLITRMANVYKLQVHRFMYQEYWGYDLRRDKVERKLPMAQSRVKALGKKERVIRKVLKHESNQEVGSTEESQASSSGTSLVVQGTLRDDAAQSP
jgi:hypothetical protein